MDGQQLLDAIRGIVREETENQTKVFEKRLTRLEVSYENQTQQILNLLREDYSRVAGAAAKVADYDDVKRRVGEHQSALESHNQRLTTLEKKAI